MKKNIQEIVQNVFTRVYIAQVSFFEMKRLLQASRGVERRETRRGKSLARESTRFENRGTPLFRRQATIITSCNESKRRLILTSWDDVQFQGDAGIKSSSPT